MQILFIIVAAVTLGSALMVVTARRMMHAALWLVLTLFGVAVIFASLEASFFAVVQVIVYIGAIAILIIFAVMLTRRVMTDSGSQLVKNWWVAGIACALLLGGLLYLYTTWPGFMFGPGSSPDLEITKQLGADLVNPEKYVIPFEVASVLLLAAMIGAIYVAVERKGGKA